MTTDRAIETATAIRNHERSISILGVFRPEGDTDDAHVKVLAITGGRMWAIGTGLSGVDWHGDEATLSWCWGHYYDDLANACEEVRGMVPVWTITKGAQ